MTFGGWFMLIVSVGSVATLFIWCLYKVLTIPEETEHIHGFSESKPEDSKE
jgi:hypothetical protein